MTASLVTSKSHILVVDDDIELLDLLVQELTDHFLEVSTATNGLPALELLKEKARTALF